MPKDDKEEPKSEEEIPPPDPDNWEDIQEDFKGSRKESD